VTVAGAAVAGGRAGWAVEQPAADASAPATTTPASIFRTRQG
jgi:hypothetical protein